MYAGTVNQHVTLTCTQCLVIPSWTHCLPHAWSPQLSLQLRKNVICLNWNLNYPPILVMSSSFVFLPVYTRISYWLIFRTPPAACSNTRVKTGLPRGHNYIKYGGRPRSEYRKLKGKAIETTGRVTPICGVVLPGGSL